MIRNHFDGWAATVLSVLAVAGCGGKPGEPDLFGPPGAMKANDLGPRKPVYFNETNHVALRADQAAAVGVDLSAGAEVQLEVVTQDASPLRLELHRVRRDGTTELIAPVDNTSGFYLTTFTATSDGELVIWFPKPRDATVAVRLDCLGGEARCSPERQPGESCAPWFACAEGLDCVHPNGACDIWTAFGACTRRPDVAECPTLGGPQGPSSAGGGLGSAAQTPYCGCDGRTYASECFARAAGVDVAWAGTCGAR
jgi:hypothetical protein